MALTPLQVLASSVELPQPVDFTGSTYGLIAVIVFISAYALVISEEFLHLRKSKPVIVAAGIIWILVSIAYSRSGDHQTAGVMIRHNIEEFAELMLFLLAAMTYVNTMEERNVFAALRSWLVSHGFSYMGVFWITGLLAFLISPLADNLTTALLLAAVVIAISDGNRKFTVVACINIVVAANAGGAFSPFGDITTLMVWQKGIIGVTVAGELAGAGRTDVHRDPERIATAGQRVRQYKTLRHADRGAVSAHDFDGGGLPQPAASAADDRHDDRAGSAEVPRFLPEAQTCPATEFHG